MLDAILQELRIWSWPLTAGAHPLAAPVDEAVERARAASADTLGAMTALLDTLQEAERLDPAAADTLSALYLERRWPLVARLLELGLLKDGGRMRLDRLPDLLSDAGHQFAGAYGMSRDGRCDPAFLARSLFPKLAALARALRLEASTGGPDAGLTDRFAMPGPPAPETHWLRIWQTFPVDPDGPEPVDEPVVDEHGYDYVREAEHGPGPAVDTDAGLGLRLRSTVEGGAELALATFGRLALPVGRVPWQLEFLLDGEPVRLVFPPSRPPRLDHGERLELAIEATYGEAGPTLGDPDETRLELGEVAFTVGAWVTADGLDGTVGFSVSDGAVFIVPQGGFIARVLPAEGLRIAFDLAMSLSRSRGFSFDGAVGLEWRLPRRVQLGPLGFEEMLLAVRATTDGPPFEAIFAASLSLKLGPLKASVQDIGLELALQRTESGVRPRFGFKPPVGLGLSIDASAVRGGGFLAFDIDADRYSGVLQLVVRDTIELNALALLETNVPNVGYSLMAAIYSSFPGVPLGMGFTLTGIGGMLALHRTLNPEALVQAVVEDRLDALLFPTGDLVARAPALFSSLRQLFPPAHGRFLFGPFVQLEWARVVTAELGLLLELPAPVRVLVVGRAHVALPESKAILELNLQIMGLLDTERRFFHLQGQLTDSRLLFLHISGGFLLHIGWGRPRRFILSVGGFHPAWVRPEGVLALDRVDRLRIALVSNAVLDVALEGYFAITSNSLQFGGRLSLDLDLRVLTIRGWLAFDALIQWNPVHFDVAVDAGLEVKIRRFTLASVRVLGALSGPNPWRLRGKLKVSILFIRLKVGFDKTFGRTAPVAVEAVRMPRALLQTALSDPDAWSVAAPECTPARLRELPRHVADPHATLRFEQHQVPLDTPIARADGQDLDQAHRFVADADDVVHNDFALGALQPWTDATRLARPGYTPRPAGARWRETQAVAGAAASRSIEVESVHRTRGDALPPTHHAISAVIDGPPLSTLLAAG